MFWKLLNRLPSTNARNDGAGVSSIAEAERLIAAGDRAGNEDKPGEACEQYRKAVAAAPGYAKAWLNLGVGLEAAGDVDGAVKSYETALAIEPTNAYASYNLGKAFYKRGELSRAEELLHSALKHKLEFPEAQVVLSGVYESKGDVYSAVAALEVALKQRPDWAGALSNYAVVLKKLGRFREAESALSRVMALDPGNADACYELAMLRHARGALQEAEKLLHIALEHKPDFLEAYDTLFRMYYSQGNFDAAKEAVEAALTIRPDDADALKNFGIVLRNLARLTEAEGALRRATAIAPDVWGYWELGAVLLEQSRVTEALTALRAARKLDPDRFDLESAELFALNFCDETTNDTLFARHKAFGTRIERIHLSRFTPFKNIKDSERRLRIGYVSGDFNSNPVGLFLIPLLERHDKAAYEVYCYSVSTRADDFTRQLQSQPVIWRDAASTSHADLADAINHDGIDILVDLSGHSRRSRLVVFAQQPAPIQVSWLGYLSTTGMTRIQYRFCDHYTDPPGATDQFHTEAVYQLPHSQWCYRPRVAIDYSCSGMPPFRKNGYITFGSFNAAPKLSPSVCELWSKILNALPDSRLLIMGVPNGRGRDGLVEYFENAGIARTRITLVGPVALQEYFRCFNLVDIALDTTPYSGGTTTCDALWMGVPVITAPGSRSISRSAFSILSTVGLSEWIAWTPEDYVRLAVRFAEKVVVLTELRQTLRKRMSESPLMDEVRFASDIEHAYRQMWRAWCGAAV